MAVLSKEGIEAEFESIFLRGSGRRKNIRAAKYWLTLSECDLILPNGKRYKPGEERSRSFSIKPGETAFVSTAEQIAMPANLIGMIGPRFNSAEHGVLFFGGTVVDPGYGLKVLGDKREPGEPLSFHIANLGRDSIELRPGQDTIASIVFFKVGDPPDTNELRDPDQLAVLAPGNARRELFREKAKQRPPGALSLVQDLSRNRKRLDKLEASVTQVVTLGVIVLIAALLGAITAAIFEIDAGSSGDTTTAVVPRADEVAADGSSTPEWKTVGLTVAALGLGAILLAMAFGLFAHSYAWLRGARRKIELRDSYPYD